MCARGVLEPGLGHAPNLPRVQVQSLVASACREKRCAQGVSTVQYWILLVIAGLLETGWAVGLKYADGFTRLWPSVWTAVALVMSIFLLSLAARGLPIGTAYPVWVGIGAVGAVILGVLLFDEPLSTARVAFTLLLVVSIIGLKMTTGEPVVRAV